MQVSNLHLWCAYPKDLEAQEVAGACAEMLSERERKAWSRPLSEDLRSVSLSSRVLARVALSRAHPLLPWEWEFAADRRGKPVTRPECGLCFSQSSSSELALCLVGERTEVGVAAEPRSSAKDLLWRSETYLSPIEKGQLFALPGALKGDRALTLWTLKQAYLKARGLGVAIPLHKITFLFGGEAGIKMMLGPTLGDLAGRWQFGLVDYAEHRIALVVERKESCRLEILEARPLIGRPAEVRVGVLGWFPWA